MCRKRRPILSINHLLSFFWNICAHGTNHTECSLYKRRKKQSKFAQHFPLALQFDSICWAKPSAKVCKKHYTSWHARYGYRTPFQWCLAYEAMHPSSKWWWRCPCVHRRLRPLWPGYVVVVVYFILCKMPSAHARCVKCCNDVDMGIIGVDTHHYGLYGLSGLAAASRQNIMVLSYLKLNL